jgi:hypothetical protein
MVPGGAASMAAAMVASMVPAPAMVGLTVPVGPMVAASMVAEESGVSRGRREERDEKEADDQQRRAHGRGLSVGPRTPKVYTLRSMFRKWEPVDVVCAGIALTVCGILLAGAVSSMIAPDIWTQNDSDVFAAALGAMISVVTLWVGNHFGRRANKRPPDPGQTDRRPPASHGE